MTSHFRVNKENNILYYKGREVSSDGITLEGKKAVLIFEEDYCFICERNEVVLWIEDYIEATGRINLEVKILELDFDI